MSSTETSPLLQDARHLLQQVISNHHDRTSPPIPTIPEEAGATHRFGPKLLASLVVDSIPGTIAFNVFVLILSQTELQSHPLLHPTKLGTNHRHHRDRSSRSRTTLRRRIFHDARIRHWRVRFMIRIVRFVSHDVFFFFFASEQVGASHSEAARRWTRSDHRPSPVAFTRPICPSISSDASSSYGSSSSPSASCGSSWNPSSWPSESPSVSAKTFKTSCAYSSLQPQDSSRLNRSRNTCNVRVSPRAF